MVDIDAAVRTHVSQLDALHAEWAPVVAAGPPGAQTEYHMAWLTSLYSHLKCAPAVARHATR